MTSWGEKIEKKKTTKIQKFVLINVEERKKKLYNVLKTLTPLGVKVLYYGEFIFIKSKNKLY